MKKVFLRVVSAVCLLSVIFLFTACKKEPQGNDTSDSSPLFHTVSFNTNGGSAISSVKIENGKYLPRPQNPSLDNYVFYGWEYNNSPWLFEYNQVKQSITLNAIWVSAEKLFKITPTDDGLSLVGITQQKSFETLNVPSMINGKKVVSISDGAFKMIHSSYAKHIVFPDTVTTIGSEAFMDISQTALTFEGDITQLGESSFKDCSTLNSISLGRGMESIPFQSFLGCSALQSITIPDGVKIISEDAFAECVSLSAVILPSSLTAIENSAFDNCDSIKYVLFKGTPDQFDSIEIAAFNDCLINASVYYYSEQEPTQSGMFWHYDADNLPIIW